jgi:hypothetical protein
MLIRQRTRNTPAPVAAPTTTHSRERGIIIYRQTSNAGHDCPWLPGIAEQNGLAGRVLPQNDGSYRALRWQSRGGYADLGTFNFCADAIRALD